MPPATTTPVARQISRRLIWEATLNAGPISRTRLAQLTGLSKQTTTEVVRELALDGWLAEHGREQGVSGRSAATYVVEPACAYALGGEIGATKIRLAFADIAGNIAAEGEEPTDPGGGYHVLEQVSKMALRLADEAGIEFSKVRTATIGSPGVADPNTGFVEAAPQLSGFDKIGVRSELSRRLGMSVTLDNDVNLATLGEAWRGKAAGIGNFVFIALGSGLGMGAMSDGILMRGAHGWAGEIAFMPIGGDPFDARCFKKGTLESSIAADAIAARYIAAGGEHSVTVPEIFDRYARGEAIALAVIEEIARILALAIAAIITLYDPEKIILGGGIGGRVELGDIVSKYLARCAPHPAPIETSVLHSRATMLGGVHAALDQLYRILFAVDTPPGSLAPPKMSVAEISKHAKLIGTS